MAHHDLWGWADLEGLAARCSRRIKSALLLVHEQHTQWVVFKDSRSDATIASEEGWVEADVTLVRLALEKADELYPFANNGASPAQGDRLTAMRDLAFSFSKDALVVLVRPMMRDLSNALIGGDEAFAEFKSFQGADSDAESSTALGLPATEALVTDARVALRSCNQLYEFANNNSTFGGQRDRLEDWRILS